MPSEWIIPLISAVAGLSGTIIGAVASYLAQKQALTTKRNYDAAALAGALGAEISAYLTLMRVRDHVSNAKRLATDLRAGRRTQIRGFLEKEAKPLDEFPFFKSQIGSLGLLGPSLCEEVATYYTLISGVQSTVISAERGKYDELPAADKASIVDHETQLWSSALLVGASLVPKLAALAHK